jgi:hypothetical protein
LPLTHLHSVEAERKAAALTQDAMRDYVAHLQHATLQLRHTALAPPGAPLAAPAESALSRLEGLLLLAPAEGSDGGAALQHQHGAGPAASSSIGARGHEAAAAVGGPGASVVSAYGAGYLHAYTGHSTAHATSAAAAALPPGPQGRYVVAQPAAAPRKFS